LFFASPFFEAALSGNWSETARPPSVVAISHTTSDPAEGNVRQEDSKDPSSLESEDLELTLEFDLLQGGNESREHDSANRPEIQHHPDGSGSTSATVAKLEGSQTRTETPSSTKKAPAAQAIVHRHPKNGPDALIVLKEERVRDWPSPTYYRMILLVRTRRTHSMISLDLYTHSGLI
jgi:hypothetical protein